jgi:uncharacterized protein YbjT (DUF2867 family)
MIVLVAGTTGYVGSRLVPLLLREGHEVRAGTRSRSALDDYFWADRVTPVDLDVNDPDSCRAAVDGVDAVVYLVHGLSGDDFRDNDKRAAQNVADAVTAAGVGRVVYLSGLVPDVPEDELSEHIVSRLEVERVLTGTPATTITLRAAVLVGAASTSFEVVRQISDRLPVQPLPRWMDSEVQPIAVVDVLEALVGALEVPGPSRHYDVGGTERLSYGDLIRTYADVAGTRRLAVTVPGLPTGLVGKMAGRLTDVDGPTVESLVESLKHSMVCAEDDFRADLLPEGHELVGLRDALARALDDPDPSVPGADRDPMAPLSSDPDWVGRPA